MLQSEHFCALQAPTIIYRAAFACIPCHLTSAMRFLPTAPFHEGVDLLPATKRASDNARLFSIPE
jgi:hypothetical protein